MTGVRSICQEPPGKQSADTNRTMAACLLLLSQSVASIPGCCCVPSPTSARCIISFNSFGSFGLFKHLQS